MNFADQKILVAGMGGSGISMLAFFRANGGKPAAYDAELSAQRQSELQAQFPGLRCFSGSLKDALANGFDLLAISPGISERQPEIAAFCEQGGRVVGDVEILAQVLNRRGDKVIAITGSNGKTTVTSLVGHLCRESGLDTVVAGNIGLPVLEAEMQRGGKAADVWVLELSSFQLDHTRSLNAAAAAVLNVSEDHLERYDDLLDYAHAKDRIFRGNGVQVLNADDVFCRAMRREGREVRYFSLEKPADYWLDAVSGSLKQADETLMAQEDVPLNGSHNTANVLAAFALCEAVGVSRADLLKHVRTFKGLSHRVEKIGVKNGITFIDDSKGTNVGATAAAIAGLPEKILLIAGGQGKGQDFSPLAPLLAAKARAVYLIGIDAPKMAADLSGCGVELVHCADLPEAVNRAYAAAQEGDTVLLSPACASFDMFKGYAHRAQVFIEAFERL